MLHLGSHSCRGNNSHSRFPQDASFLQTDRGRGAYYSDDPMGGSRGPLQCLSSRYRATGVGPYCGLKRIYRPDTSLQVSLLH